MNSARAVYILYDFHSGAGHWTPRSRFLREECAHQGHGSLSPEFGKQFTIWRHMHGFLTHEGCQAAFNAHPEWRDA